MNRKTILRGDFVWIARQSKKENLYDTKTILGRDFVWIARQS